MTKSTHNFSSISDKELNKIHDGESLFNTLYANGVSFPRPVEDSGENIRDLYNRFVNAEKKILQSNKCYITVDFHNGLFYGFDLCRIKGDCHNVDVIGISEKRCCYRHCVDSSELLKNHSGFYEISVQFFDKVMSMIQECEKEISVIMEQNFNVSNMIYNYRELARYCRIYRQYSIDKDLLYYTDEMPEMDISEFENKLFEHNDLVDGTMGKMVDELTNEFIKKHRYIICDNGLHHYGIRHFNQFYKNYDLIPESGYTINNTGIYTKSEYISYVSKRDSLDTCGFIDYSSLNSPLSLNTSFYNGDIYILNDDSLGDKLFDDYKEINKVVSEMYDKVRMEKQQ